MSGLANTGSELLGIVEKELQGRCIHTLQTDSFSALTDGSFQ